MISENDDRTGDTKMPAIPPSDYEGTIASWMVWLVANGYLSDGSEKWYGDIMLDPEVYAKLLKDCESN